MTSKYINSQESQPPPLTGKISLPEKGGERSAGPPVREVRGPVSLPCLYSNNCTEQGEERKAEAIIALASLLSPYHKRAAETLHVNVERLIRESVSLAHVGFMTLTFKENITDNTEAAKRFKSLNSHFLATDPRFGLKIVVKEPQRRGAWHYHLLVNLTCDIRTGVDFDALAKGDYRSAGPDLRQIWRDLREACAKYGFGRSELLPIKSNAQAMAYYLGKYISKAIGQRSPEQKGVRLVNYSKGWLRNSPKFSWNTENSALWRKKLQLFAKIHGCDDFYQLSEKLGPNWAWRYLEDILNVMETYIDHAQEYKYENGCRINRETGEVMTSEELHYKPVIFERIEKNNRIKWDLLHAEARDEIPITMAYREHLKRHRTKEEAKIRIADVKRQYSPTKEDLDESKALVAERVKYRQWLDLQPPPPF